MADFQLINLQETSPSIVGRRCTDFHLVQLLDDSGILDPAHITYIKFDDIWYQFFFESTWAFCIEGHAPPAADENSYLKPDLQLNAWARSKISGVEMLESLTYQDLGNTATLTFVFSGTSQVELQSDLGSGTTSITVSS